MILKFTHLPVIVITTLICTLTACQGKKQDDTKNVKEEKKSSLTNDSLKQETTVQEKTPPEPVVDPQVIALLQKIKTPLTLPYVVDSVSLIEMFDNSGDEGSLSSDEVKLLSVQLKNNSPASTGSSAIDGFYKIDSLKSNDLYADYKAKIDIGMLETATAQYVGQIKLSEDKSLVIWKVFNASYQACPYYEAKVVFATLMNKKQVSTTLIIGEDAGGGEGAYWSKSKISSKTNEGFINLAIDDINSTEDENNDYQELVTKKNYEERYQITDKLVKVEM